MCAMKNQSFGRSCDHVTHLCGRFNKGLSLLTNHFEKLSVAENDAQLQSYNHLGVKSRPNQGVNVTGFLA